MRNLGIASLIAVTCMAVVAYAQDLQRDMSPMRGAVVLSDAPARALDAATCSLPDGTRTIYYPVGTRGVESFAEYQGRRYQCERTYDDALRPSGVAWIRVR
jgi:hypothetical protein